MTDAELGAWVRKNVIPTLTVCAISLAFVKLAQLIGLL